MANLPDADRAAIWADFMRQLSDAHESCALSKTELRAAVNAADSWIETNAASYNSAIPQPARSALTTKQKALLLTALTLRRYEVI